MARGPSLAVTWLGHATLRLALDGATILTDPALRPRMGGLIRHAAQPKPSTWQGVDAVLVSHAHHDHLDLPSLGLLDPDLHVVVPRGLGALVRGAGMRQVSEVDVGDRFAVGSVVIEVVPALHAGRRVPRGPTAPAIGYVIEGSQRVYFAGDTGLFEAMEEIGRTWPRPRTPAGVGLGSPTARRTPRPSGCCQCPHPAPSNPRDTDPLGHLLAGRHALGRPRSIPAAGRGVRAARGNRGTGRRRYCPRPW